MKKPPSNSVSLIDPGEVDRINKLAQSALNGASVARSQIQLAGRYAAECGALLAAEKSRIIKEKGRGAWTIFFETHHRHLITIRTAQRWMGLSVSMRIKVENDNVVSPSPSLGDTKPGHLLSDDGHIEDANGARVTMLALELFPKKLAVPVEGDRPAARLVSHLNVINRFKAWLAEWKKQNDYQPPTGAQIELFRKDFREVIDFVKSLGV